MRPLITRRQFVVGAGTTGLGLLAGCERWPGQAQPAPRPFHVGYVGLGYNPSVGSSALEAFREELREHGYVEGQNIHLEVRGAAGRQERLDELVAEVLRDPLDVLVAASSPTVQAAKRATGTVPIVMANASDPVETGLVDSLARPGGNITGMSEMLPPLSRKRLELLREATTGASRVGVLWGPDDVGSAIAWRETQIAAQQLGLRLQSLEVRVPEDLSGVLDAALAEHADALIALPNPLLVVHAQRIADFAVQNRLPTMVAARPAVEAGGLMTYGPNSAAMHRRAAYYVDRILKGTKPADLPVEQPMTFDFVVNMKTARELGITFPNEIMLQVTEVIE
jgi:putative ABC transport system substrate-binding protein